MTSLYEPRKRAFTAWTSLLDREPRWEKLLERAGLRVNARCEESFLESLAAKVRVDRKLKGFEDFAGVGQRGIEPGKPSYSLLYHALASPGVMQYEGKPLRAFASEEELESIEDLVYAFNRPTVDELKARAHGSELGCAVFAYEYRTAPDTVHRRHADLCFSRTGIARTGNHDAHYLAHARGYLPSIGPNETSGDKSLNEDKETTIRVVPSRFGVFIAAHRTGNKSSFGPMRFIEGGHKPDSQQSFWVPLHKLFNGPDCLRGLDLSIDWQSLHVNEKIRRVHMYLRDKGYETGWKAPEINEPPFRFEDNLATVVESSGGGSAKVLPQTQKALVKAAEFRGQPLAFDVQLNPRLYKTSLWLSSRDDTNYKAPEFVSLRAGLSKRRQRDLRKAGDFDAIVGKGGFEAIHYQDFTADGYIAAKCPQIAEAFPTIVPAYSIIAVPDFFPLVSQRQLAEWYESEVHVPATVKQILWSHDTKPWPLSDERLAANLRLHPAGLFPGFSPNDTTVSAVISPVYQNMKVGNATFASPTLRQTHMPDHAAGVMAPGWDTSRDELDGHGHFAAYGLGSPFPEDQKLCAALSAFWPAATPDTTRFYPQEFYRSTTPLPDIYAEWDELPRPKKVKPQGGVERYEYNSLGYVDYVKVALENGFRLRRLADVTFQQFAEWTMVMAAVHLALRANSVARAKKWYVPEFDLVQSKHKARLGQAEKETNVRLTPGHTYRMVVFRGKVLNTKASKPGKVLVSVEQRYLVFADSQTVLLQDERGHWTAK
jgi:hypothetical protein